VRGLKTDSQRLMDFVQKVQHDPETNCMKDKPEDVCANLLNAAMAYVRHYHKYKDDLPAMDMYGSLYKHCCGIAGHLDIDTIIKELDEDRKEQIQ
jgi:hypothetical protein